MKKNAAPELDATWWRKNQPDGLGTAKDLEKALGEFTKAFAALEASGAEDDLTDCTKSLDGVEQAVKKVQADITKTLKSPPKTKFDAEDWRFTQDALGRYERVVTDARAKAEALLDATVFGNPERYRKYLKEQFAKLKDGPMAFAFGAGGKPSEHRLALHRSATPESLATRLRNEAGLKKLCLGRASADAARPTTLLLDIQGQPLSGLNKKYQAVRRRFGPLHFERIVLRVDGKEVADVVDPLDPPDDEPPADEIAADVAPTQPGPSAPPQALGHWKAAREAAVAKLNRLGAAIAASEDPDTREALQRLHGVVSRLSPAPATAGDVAALEHFIDQDEVFPDLETPNPFGIDLSLRLPLLNALTLLKQELSPTRP